MCKINILKYFLKHKIKILNKRLSKFNKLIRLICQISLSNL
jgi:hypothetical protein